MKVPAPGERVFLSAEWRDLVMLNYEEDAGLLSPYITPGTELDSFGGKTFVSLVGFRFLRTKLFGILPIPFHSNFDEVNLRFYVRRQEGAALRRGVVFIREIVPRRAIAGVARLVYGENYTHHAMRHSINKDGACYSAEYEWQFERRWCRLYADTTGIPATPLEGGLEQFITEHHWDTRGGAMEPAWNIMFHILAGRCGQLSALASRAMVKPCTARDLAVSSPASQTPPSSLMARRSKCSWAGESHERSRSSASFNIPSSRVGSL